jgi:hypothetical protein
MPIIHLASSDTPLETVKRQLRKTNFGLWCIKCEEFFAVAVHEGEPNAIQTKFESDGPIMFKCPFCSALQKREASEIIELKLTEALKRKPPRPATAH